VLSVETHDVDVERFKEACWLVGLKSGSESLTVAKTC
jgi:hypothetical protein